MTANTLAAMAVVAAALTVGGYLMLTWGSTPAAVGHMELRPDDQELVAQGRSVYAENCASCYGRDLEGQENWRSRDADGMLPAPPHDVTGHTWRT